MAIIRAITLLKNGGLVSVGHNGGYFISKLTANGQNDLSFGDNGIVTDLNGTDAMAVAIDKKNNILVTGYGNGFSATIARYKSNGLVDESFGTDGHVYLDFYDYNVSKDIKPLSGGKILVTSFTTSTGDQSGTPGSPASVGVARLNNDGSLDPTFGDGGKVILGDYVPFDWSFIGTQANGKIIGAATTYLSDENEYDLFSFRLKTNGDLDTSYGTEGYSYVRYAGTQLLRSMNILSNNKILLVGSTQESDDPTTIAYPWDYEDERDFFITKLKANGNFDTRFGTSGAVSIDFGGQDTCQASVVQSNGKIVMAGMGKIAGEDKILLTRLNTNGSLDRTFGDAGKVIFSVSALNINPAWFEVTDVDIARNGKIVVSFVTGFHGQQFGIIFNANGSISSTTLRGSSADEFFVGTEKQDWIYGFDGADELYGGDGNDVISPGGDNDEMDGEEGEDTLELSESELDISLNTLLGTAEGEDIGSDHFTNMERYILGAGDDVIIGSGADEYFDGSEGLDSIYYVDSMSDLTINLRKNYALGDDIGRDILKNIEQIYSGSGDDYIVGYLNRISFLYGGSGDDVIYGGNKADHLNGESGDDMIFAGSGNDVIYAGSGNDYYNGGKGYDTVDYSIAEDGIYADLNYKEVYGINDLDVAQIGHDVLVNIENINASWYDDVVIGNSIKNIIDGGPGGDMLDGGRGMDILTGGEGYDLFMFTTKINDRKNIDTITDFVTGEDKILLDVSIFKKLSPVDPNINPEDFDPNLNEAFFVIDSEAQDADDYIIYNSETGLLYYDQNGNKAGGMFAFADIGPGYALTVEDFTLSYSIIG